jgi:hypothetical protein
MPNNPFNRSLNQPLPPGGMRVGNRIMYPDLKGDFHSTPGQAIESNQGFESDFSRGASGGCNQDSSKVPNRGN